MMMKICNVFIALLAAAPLAEAQVYANVDISDDEMERLADLG